MFCQKMQCISVPYIRGMESVHLEMQPHACTNEAELLFVSDVVGILQVHLDWGWREIQLGE